MISEQYRLNIMLAIQRAEAEGFTGLAGALVELLKMEIGP